MLQRIRLFLASFVALTAVAGCAASTDSTGHDTESVDSTQQALSSSGYTRTYYSDATHTTWVGSLNWDCDPNYRSSEGEESNYYKDTRFNCPGYHDPLLPSTTCTLCTTYTTSGGQTFTSCTGSVCPIIP